MKLPEKALQIVNFGPPAAPTNNLFLETKILKIPDFIKHGYALFSEAVQEIKMFTTKRHNHNHTTRGSVNHILNIRRGQLFTLGIIV